MRKYFTTLILFCFFLSQNFLTFAEPVENNHKGGDIIRGRIQVDENQEEEKKLFTGDVKTVEEGTKVRMTVSSVISAGYNDENDEFFAEITEDLTVAEGVLIPAGTIAHGKITEIKDSKRLGRDGYVRLDFDYLVTPDGREIPIQASMTSKRNPITSVAKVALEDTAYTLAGGVIGGFLAVKYLGLGTAIASNGYTVAGGAGVGALIGATASLARKGDNVLIAPGEEIKVKISKRIDLPVMSEEALKDEEKLLEGLKVKITNYKVEKDPFGEANTITISLNIENKTDKTFSSFDMALISDYKAVFYPSPFSNTDLWFTKIIPNSRVAGKLSFAVDNPKRKHWLVFFDQRSRKPLAKISIKNAEKRIKKSKKK